MKSFLNVVMASGAYLLMYLIGAFIAASFDISVWNESLRAGMASFGTLGAIAIFGFRISL